MIAVPQTERTLWELLKKHLPEGAHANRIESGLTGRGIPDVEICSAGQVVWLELKVMKYAKVRVTHNQAQWHRTRAAAGGQSCIVAVDPRDEDRPLYVWHGRQTKILAQDGFADLYNRYSLDDWDRFWERFFYKVSK